MNLQKKKRLPAEWSEQDAILLCWPHLSMDWQPILEEVEPLFADIAFYIAEQQRLIIIAFNSAHQTQITERLIDRNVNISSISWLIHPNNDTWCRDFGPVCVQSDNEMTALDFLFNGWGNKFTADRDNEVIQALKSHQLLSCRVVSIPLVLEGGSIESDGAGTILTTTQCLLNEQRNPGLSQQAIEQKLIELLGCERILWLKSGYLEGDDTDSHIDNLARFVSESEIVYASCNNPDDIHYQPLKAMETELKRFRTINGKPYRLTPLYIPAAIYFEGGRLPASYVNFLITNHTILMPTYNDLEDEVNLNKLQMIFSSRKVIGIPCTSIVKQSGSIHCLTMQLPAHSLLIEP